MAYYGIACCFGYCVLLGCFMVLRYCSTTPEDGKGFLRDESSELIVPGKVQGVRLLVILDAAFIFDRHAVHDFGNQFKVLVSTVYFKDAHGFLFSTVDFV
jgi:hypothetical protein